MWAILGCARTQQQSTTYWYRCQQKAANTQTLTYCWFNVILCATKLRTQPESYKQRFLSARLQCHAHTSNRVQTSASTRPFERCLWSFHRYFMHCLTDTCASKYKFTAHADERRKLKQPTRFVLGAKLMLLSKSIQRIWSITQQKDDAALQSKQTHSPEEKECEMKLMTHAPTAARNVARLSHPNNILSFAGCLHWQASINET